MNTTLLARNHIKSWAKQHGVKPRLAEVPALADLIESIPRTPPEGVNFFSDRLHLVKLETPAFERLVSLGFPPEGRFGYRPYCNVAELDAPTQVQEFFVQPLKGWLVLQIVIMATPEKRSEVLDKLVNYIIFG